MLDRSFTYHTVRIDGSESHVHNALHSKNPIHVGDEILFSYKSLSLPLSKMPGTRRFQVESVTHVLDESQKFKHTVISLITKK